MRGAEEDGGALQGGGDGWRRGNAEASGEGHDDGPHDGAPRCRESNSHGISSLAPVRVHRLGGQRSLRRPMDAGRHRHGRPSLLDHGIGRRRRASPPPSPSSAAASCSLCPGKWNDDWDIHFGSFPLRGRTTAAAAARSGSGDHDGNATQPRRSAADGAADAATGVRGHATSDAAERCFPTTTTTTAATATATSPRGGTVVGKTDGGTPGRRGKSRSLCVKMKPREVRARIV
mmetsp:Transcript_34745/g.64219  ORF Transcript_34745/g.64219 Transcript_34745/m.64219 type:complete len:232 (+) Transcript_34745:679-1374(+)